MEFMRWHGGGVNFDDSFPVVDFEQVEAMTRHRFRRSMGQDAKVEIKPYGCDDRHDAWSNTHLVTIAGCAVGYTTGPLEPIP